MRRREQALAPGALRDLEVEVVRLARRLGMEAEPAQLLDAQAQALRHVRRRSPDRQPQLLQRLDVRAPIGEPARHAAAQVDDVFVFAPGDRLDAGLLLRLRQLRSFFALLELRLAELGDRVVGGLRSGGGGELVGVVKPQPEITDPMDLGDLHLVEQSAQNEAAIDQRRALVALRRNGVDPADPRGAVGVDLHRALAQLVCRQAEDLGVRLVAGVDDRRRRRRRNSKRRRSDAKRRRWRRRRNHVVPPRARQQRVTQARKDLVCDPPHQRHHRHEVGRVRAGELRSDLHGVERLFLRSPRLDHRPHALLESQPHADCGHHVRRGHLQRRRAHGNERARGVQQVAQREQQPVLEQAMHGVAHLPQIVSRAVGIVRGHLVGDLKRGEALLARHPAEHRVAHEVLRRGAAAAEHPSDLIPERQRNSPRVSRLQGRPDHRLLPLDHVR